MGEKIKIGIIGGGAAGMTAALYAAKEGADVLLLEKNNRLGKKILMTGNGKCNLGNYDLSMEQYYSRDISLLTPFLEQFSTKESLDFFHSLGLLTKDKNGYIYPLSEQASSVLDVLRFAIEERKSQIDLHLDSDVNRIERNKMGFRIFCEKDSFLVDRVILSCGGKAYPKTGSDGKGYEIAKSFGHSIVPVVPALAGLRCKESWFKSLAGVRAEGKVSFEEDGQLISEYGEIQLTDYGISGIPVFQISRRFGYCLQKQKEVRICLDFFPKEKEEGFAEKMLQDRPTVGRHLDAESYFSGVLNKKLMMLLMKMADIKPNEEIGSVPKVKILEVYRHCKALEATVVASNSFENAQVCAGGVPLVEVSKELESKKVPGLYFAGELLDVDGRCGGYNLHWAWCSGAIAGCAAGKKKDVLR